MPDEMNKREVILTIREYENSVAMPEGERVTYLDPRGGVHLKDGDDKALDYMGHAAKCAEYLRFGDEVDAVTCGSIPVQRGQVLRYAELSCRPVRRCRCSTPNVTCAMPSDRRAATTPTAMDSPLSR